MQRSGNKCRLVFFVPVIVIWGGINLCMGQTQDKIDIKINYVAKLNEISKPADYDPNDNAAPYYKKAFDLCVKQPEQISNSDLKSWPKDLSDEKLILLKKWVSDNTEALEQLNLGTQKPYYWSEYQGRFMVEIVMPSLAEARKLTYAIYSRAKIKAADGNFKEAFSDLLTGYRFGTHFTGPKTLIEQLVGIAIRGLALQAGFQILDKEKPNPDLLKDFQLQLENLSSSKSYIIDFTAEKLFVYDHIQRIFTDDGQGNGHIPKSSSEQMEKLSEDEKQLLSELLSQLTEQQKNDWEKMDRRQTTNLTDKVFEYFSSEAYKNPAHFHNQGKDLKQIAEEMTKTNPMLNILTPAIGRVVEISFRGKVETDALITTLAILRYKAEKGQFPENLQQLIESGYLKELPIDSFSDKSLVYKTTGNDFILYSFAADFDDDGGTPSKWGEGEEGGDQVFWPVSGEQK